VDVITRAVFGVALGWFRGGVTGAIGAQLAGALVGTIATFAYLNQRGRTQPRQIETLPTDSEPDAPFQKHWSTHLIGAETQSMIASGCILVMLTLDAALVARFFNAEDTATYSAVTILGRSQFYLSATVATLLLPYAASPGRGKPLTALGFGLAVTGGLNTAGLLVLIAIPDLVVRVLYGQAYASAAPLLWHYGLHAMMLSLANVVATYLIGCGNRSIGIVALVCTALQIAAVTLWHATLDAVIIGLGVGSGAFLLGTLVMVYPANSGLPSNQAERT
jgi:O-antigen/teichoic acid export membrane protein